MKKLILILSALLTVLPIMATASSSWTGVWKLQIEGQPDRLAFLVVSENSGKLSLTYYSSQWDNKAVSLKPGEDGHLVFDTAATSRMARFDLERTAADKAKGTWRLLHPQFQDTRPFSAIRVLSMNHWNPFDGLKSLEKPNHIVDLNAFLLEKAPLKSLASFVAFWESEVDPKFYSLIEDVLYRDAKTVDKQALLKPTFELLKKREFRETATRSAKEMERVIAQIKEKGQAFYRQNPVVLMPSLGGLESDLATSDKGIAVRIGVDRVAERYPGAQFTGFLAKQQLQLALYKQFSLLDPRLGAYLIREGVSSRMAVIIGLASPDASIGLPEGTYSAKRGQLSAQKKLVLPKVQTRDKAEITGLLEGENGSREGRILAYDYGDQVCSRFKPQEILSMSPLRLIELLFEYLKDSGS